MLTEKQAAAREGKLTASQVACLMTGNKEQILNLWRLLVGDPAYVPEDLSDVWAVQLGIETEALNLEWFSRKHGPVSRRGDVMINPDFNWAACTLDGWSEKYQCPIETKHCGGFEKMTDIIARYQPQMHWQMIVTGAPQCIISVIQGAREPVVEVIPFDQEYGQVLLQRASEFMRHVHSLRPPLALDAVASPIVPTKEYDMRTNNVWVSAAADWLENRVGNTKFNDATKRLKEATPNDSKRAYGAGVVSRRNKAGSILITEESDESE